MSSLILAFFSLLFLSPLGDIPVFAAPQVKLEVPATVARGDAFVALAVSEEPVTAFNFKWMGKSYAATAVAAAQAPGGPQKWQAVMLLPVPLDAKENDFTLSVTPIRRVAASGSHVLVSWHSLVTPLAFCRLLCRAHGSGEVDTPCDKASVCDARRVQL